VFTVRYEIFKCLLPETGLSESQNRKRIQFFCTGRVCGSGYLSRYSDLLRDGRSGDRIPVAARFFAPVQTGSGAHPAFCTMGIGSFPGVKRPGRGVDHLHPTSSEVEEIVELYIYSPLGIRDVF
jgi:hypothetical protein